MGKVIHAVCVYTFGKECNPVRQTKRGRRRVFYTEHHYKAMYKTLERYVVIGFSVRWSENGNRRRRVADTRVVIGDNI